MYCSYANEIYDHFDDTLKLHDKLKARFTKTKQPQQLEVLKAQSQELVVMREFTLLNSRWINVITSCPKINHP
jgi:UTP-glucose-1-phosphate uridylyltransferase